MGFVAAALLSACQGDPGRPQLDGVSAAPLHVAPDGSYWSGRTNGRLFVSRDAGASWREAPVPARAGDGLLSGGDDLDLVRFLSAEVGIIPGSIRGEYGYLRTEDGGKDWHFHELPSRMLPNAVHASRDGTAWIVGHTGQVFLSEDLGLGWAEMPTPFADAIRPASVFFESPLRGVLGGGHNRIFVTGDGGKSWTRIATPIDGLSTDEEKSRQSSYLVTVNWPDGSFGTVPQPPGPSIPVLKVRTFGDGLVVQQKDVYATPALDPPVWRKLAVDDQAVVDFELHPDGLAVVDELGFVSVLAQDFSPRWRSRSCLDRGKWLSVDGKDVLVYDGRSTLLRVESGGEGIVAPLQQSREGARWNVLSFDLGRDGVLWGITETALCRSEDYGRTWVSVADLPDAFAAVVTSVEISAPGQVLLWDYDSMQFWSTRSGRFQPVALADETKFDVQVEGLQKRENLWLAYGMRYPKGKLPGVAGMIHGVAVGDTIDGIVLASTDQGTTWSELHAWPGGQIEALHWDEAGNLLAHRAGGGIRKGKLELSPLRVDFETVVEPGSLVDLDYGITFAFTSEAEGELLGGTFYGENEEHYRTRDGGRTWHAFSASEDWSWATQYRLGSGVRVRVTDEPEYEWSDPPEGPDVVEIVGRRENRWEFEGVRRARVDQAGRLLVELDDGALRALSPDGREWTTLRDPW